MNICFSRAPSRRALAAALAAPWLIAPVVARAEDLPQDVLVIAQKQRQTIENAAAPPATVTADTIARTINAMNVEDTVKYLPGLIVHNRHVGDTQAPLAIRTSGLGASARSLIYADGVLLSSLIGNNNSSASPRWGMVSPEEIARIDILYGPFSAAYAGNSIGAVVNITTRLPDRLEGSITAGTSVQRFDQYDTHETLPAWQVSATLGDRFGPLALFGSITHTTSNSQPLSYVTGLRPAAPLPPGTPGVPTHGGFDDLNRTAQAIRVFGASGFEHQKQDIIKLKAALDLSPAVRLTYVGGLFLNDTDSTAQTYLTDTASGLPVYVSPATPSPRQLNIAGYGYTIAPSAFSGGVYHYDERHWSHALSAIGSSGRFDWQVIGTLYAFDHDVQRIPTTALPSAQTGGAGTITRLDGTGWKTLDAKGAWTPDAAATHGISFGAHADWITLASNRYVTADWINGSEGALNQQSKGKTRTAALWAQDAWKLLPALTLTLGGRYEWWKAYDGVNFPSPVVPGTAVIQPGLSASRFSPKASLAWEVAKDWTVRLSFGEAWRFPTVGELYQVVTTPAPGAIPNPNLRPERAVSEELAVERHDSHGSVRLSLFNESVNDALISQLGSITINGTLTSATFVQNVDRTRARGIEVAFQRTDIVPRIDVSGSVTYADATTRKDAALPTAEGKLLPSVPHWKSTLVVTWRPTDQISLTAAGRYASRMYGSLDNSDVVGNTYQGFYTYLVVDLRAQFRVTEHWSLGLGVDNVNNDRYFLFHPFPQRSFSADATWHL